MFHAVIRHCRPAGDTGDDDGAAGRFVSNFPVEGEDLPYKVEVWDPTGSFIELVVAVTMSAAIGYAAFYAATSERPNRDITLSFKGRVLSRAARRSH